MVLRILKMIATNSFLAACIKFVFSLGSAWGPNEGVYSTPHDPLAGLRGPTSKGEEQSRGGMGEGERRRGEEGNGGPALLLQIRGSVPGMRLILALSSFLFVVMFIELYVCVFFSVSTFFYFPTINVFIFLSDIHFLNYSILFRSLMWPICAESAVTSQPTNFIRLVVWIFWA